MPPLIAKVTHVIFDMDGLLIESESAYDRVLSEIGAQYGAALTREIKLKILGTTELDTARIAIHEMKLPITLEDFLQMYRKRVKELLSNPPLLPGAQELVLHLHKHGVPIAVATSSSQESMLLKTQYLQDIFSKFSHIVCGSTDPEVKQGKPAPDIFLVCAKRFNDNPKPENCLVLEDAPNGTRGAMTAGMYAVLVPHADVPEEMRQPATKVINSLLEFKPEEFGLPAFNS